MLFKRKKAFLSLLYIVLIFWKARAKPKIRLWKKIFESVAMQKSLETILVYVFLKVET